MTVLCKHRRPGNRCTIDAYGPGKTMSDGVCLGLCQQYNGPDRAPLLEQLEAKYAKPSSAPRPASPRLMPGLLLRYIIHFALDCIDAFIRPRARHKLWILDRVRTCGGCKVREILIDHYTLHLLRSWRRWLVTEVT